MAGCRSPHCASEQHAFKSSEDHHPDSMVFGHDSEPRRLLSVRALGSSCPSGLRRQARGFAMSWTQRSFVEAWNNFFFAKQSPVPIALFRITYGLLLIATLVLLRPDWLAWYGSHAWISLQTMQTVEPGTRINLFSIIPQSDGWINALFWVFLGSTILLTLGFLTRINSVIVFLCLTSIHQRNLFITHGGDTFLRLAGFFLMFAPAGAALSFDRLLRIWRGKMKRGTELGARPRPQRPWAQRMIQIQRFFIYF